MEKTWYIKNIRINPLKYKINYAICIYGEECKDDLKEKLHNLK